MIPEQFDRINSSSNFGTAFFLFHSVLLTRFYFPPHSLSSVSPESFVFLGARDVSLQSVTTYVHVGRNMKLSNILRGNKELWTTST